MACLAPAQTEIDCPHCRPGVETYKYMHERYIFDVDQARGIVQDGREPEEIEEESVQWCVDTTRIYPQHVAHVDPRFPGIIAHVFYPLPDGTEAHGHLLIDGNHRAARCVELEQPFFAYILTEDESRAILKCSPSHPESNPSDNRTAGQNQRKSTTRQVKNRTLSRT